MEVVWKGSRVFVSLFLRAGGRDLGDSNNDTSHIAGTVVLCNRSMEWEVYLASPVDETGITDCFRKIFDLQLL